MYFSFPYFFRFSVSPLLPLLSRRIAPIYFHVYSKQSEQSQRHVYLLSFVNKDTVTPSHAIDFSALLSPPSPFPTRRSYYSTCRELSPTLMLLLLQDKHLFFFWCVCMCVSQPAFTAVTFYAYAFWGTKR